MSKKSDGADQEKQIEAISKYPLETLLTVALCVPISGDP